MRCVLCCTIVARSCSRERNELRSLRRKQAILDSREYAFCLFPGRDFADTATGTFAPRTVI